MKENKKRIAAICLTSQQSGWSDHFATMIIGLSKIDFQPVVYTSLEAAKSFDFEGPDGFEIVKLSYNKSSIFSSLNLIYKAAKEINSSKFDCIFLYGESPQHLIFLLLLRGVIISHIADPNPHRGVGIITRFVFRISHIAYIFKSRKIFFASQNVLKSFVLEYYSMRALDLFKDKLSVVRFANLMQIDKPICNQKNSNQKDWDFIYFGRAEPYKGIDILFEAISLLSEKNIYPKILIISRNFSYKLIPDGVEIIKDYLSHEELASYISRSKWGVFPYTDATGTHTVQICNQCGVPVLASSVGSFEDYIIQDVNGALVPKSDPVALSLKIRSIMIGEIKTLERNHLIEWSSEYFSNFQSTIQFRKILVDAIDSAH